jgi:hypothetical protein
MVGMDRPTGPQLRWARAGLLAAVAMASGTLAHASAGGLMPSRTAMVVLFGICVVGAASLLGRPASTLRVVVLVMAGQTFIHGALTALAGHKGDPPLTRAPVSRTLPHVPVPSTGSGSRSGSLYDQLYANRPTGIAPTQLTVPAPVQHLVADMTGPHAAMALAHLAAAAVVGLWLARGEHALWTILNLLQAARSGLIRSVTESPALERMVLARLTLSLARHVHWPASVEMVRPRQDTRLLARSVVRRGPPRHLPA